jgi:hypothetical protein
MWLSGSADGYAQSESYNFGYMYLTEYHSYGNLAVKASNFYFESVT